MSTYRFVTHWRFQAPLDRVWEEIYHSERWPEWWKAVESVVAVKSGDDRGVGAIRRYTWKGALPYRLRFDMRTTRVEPCTHLEGVAEGELSGCGRWHFSAQESTTRVRYDWEVDATKPWMRLLHPVLRPLFEWNHDTVMRWGEEGLVRRLGGSTRPAGRSVN